MEDWAGYLAYNGWPTDVGTRSNVSFQAYLDNVRAKTGKSAEDLKRLAGKKGLVEYGDIIAWLKEDFGLGLGHARAIVHYIRRGSEPAIGEGKKKTPGTRR